MKYLKSILLMTLLLGLTASSFAQRGQNKRTFQDRPGPCAYQANDVNRAMFRIPDLTDEQKEQIRNIRLENRSAMLPYRNQINEKRARLQTLTTGDQQDLDAANQVVEEIGVLRTEMMKQRLANRVKVRDVLTEEQRVIFDSHPGPALGSRMNRGPRGWR